MFTVNFRILIGAIHGSNVFVNGSALSHQRIEKGQIILVKGPHAITPVFAEVYDYSYKGKNASYNWEIV